MRLRSSNLLLSVTIDRLFYYSGDTIHAEILLDNTKGKETCRGVEVQLARYITGEGHDSRNKLINNQQFYEITIIKKENLDLELKVGDKNQFSFDILIPSVDETSYMAKFLTEDEELIMQSWTPTFEGQSISVKYYVYTRLLFENIPYEKS